jgi:putative membrane protein
MSYRDLPALNAALNSLAAILLIVGYVLIKQKREVAHKWTMLGAFGVSVVFLVSYLTYHQLLFANEGIRGVPFTGPQPIRTLYYGMLLSHVLLAAAVPVLAIGTIYHGLKDNRPKHRRWAWWTFPIWLYVSVTGVLIYVLLYHVYPHSSPML